jgi:hypothetical protein
MTGTYKFFFAVDCATIRVIIWDLFANLQPPLYRFHSVNGVALVFSMIIVNN